jgi:hypothetical protein
MPMCRSRGRNGHGIARGWLGAIAICFGSAFGVAGGQEGTTMVPLRVVVERVGSFTETGESATLTLEDGSICVVSRKAPNFSLWSRLLKHAQRYRSPVYVACEPSTREVEVLLPTDAYNVESLTPDAESGGFCVSFRQSAAIHYLKRARRNHDEMKRVLEEALRTGQQVLITDDPQTMEIIDVRFPRAGSGPFES